MLSVILLVMAFLLIFISSVMLYGKSKYAPYWFGRLKRTGKDFPYLFRAVAYALSLCGLYLAITEFDGSTGFFIWLMYLMMAFSIVVLVLPFAMKLSNYRKGHAS